jgi:membrane-associated protein
MEIVTQIIDLFLHLDVHLGEIIGQYGTLTYVILFAIIFCETGLVVTPFLPGDSLLFAVGSFVALGLLDGGISFMLLAGAAILGDMVNYWTGRVFGARGFSENARFLKKRYLDQTHAFYERHGAKTIVIARFVPIVRTFAPFVAGMGRMQYRRFTLYNVSGAVLWVASCVGAGYVFGNIPVVKEHFSLVVLGIIGISLLPVAIGFLRSKQAK